MIYMDNGATSWPKPPEVLETLMDVTANYCANPGRAGHFMAARTAQEIFKTRLAAAYLFNIEDPGQIIFTKNCTEAINMALMGLLKEGDHVVTSSMEHNSVMRPLYYLRKKGVETTIVPCDTEGRLDPENVRRALQSRTRLIVLTAASNVTGTMMPLEEIGRMAMRRGILFMVDGAQGAGVMDLDVKKHHIDILAAPGHKGLLGPQGTGLLYIRKGTGMSPLLMGGTGSSSRELQQPQEFPEGYEAGTVNSPGIIALGAGIRFINKIGTEVIRAHECKLTERLQEGLSEIRGVTLYGPQDSFRKTAVAAMNIVGMDCEEAAMILNDRYGIAVRAGFHCSGMAHDTIGTGQTGCIRLCPGFYTGERDIEEVIAAIKNLAASAARF